MLEEKKMALTPVSQLGEFGLIKHLTDKFKKPSSELGIGDDASIINPENKSGYFHRCFSRRRTF